MRAVFLGPPGVGKGTQATRFASSRKLAHVATGDILRAAVAEGTELGKKAKEYMTAGKLVPDDLVNDVVDWRLRKPDAEPGFCLDGYPRTLPQAEALDRSLAGRNLKLDAIISLEIKDDELIERASGRVVCRGCGAPYNLRSAPPKTAGICDRCGQPLYRRDDDKPETVKERLKVYREQTEPLIQFYEKQSILRRVNASQTIEAISKELDKLFPKNPKDTQVQKSPTNPSNPQPAES